ncbi:MAG TPA: glycosyltransferase family 39 protein, partial [Chloroflexota bacterium]|nr:glycosyltransferase family 39 protein [Chloroflexota bacterium]
MARRYRFVIAACCLLAAGLRLYKLNDANPWWDEGFTYWLASQDVPGMLLRTAGDTHPPLSYLLYQLWMPLAGRAIYALRFQAVLFGVLTVPVCAALARRLAGQWAGVFAALLLAISPFHIWWSQQIRMYALVALLCALSMCLFVRATGLTHRPVALPGDASLDAQHDKRGQRPEAKAGYGTLVALAGVNAAGLYTLYFFAVLVLLEGLFISWLWVQRPNSQFPIPNSKQRVVLPLASCLLPAALLLPWLAYFRQHAITFAAEPSSPLTWPQFLEASWSELTLGIDTGVQAYTPLLIGLGVVAASLLVLLLLRSDAIRKENGPFRPWLLVVAAGLPLAAYGVTLLQGLFFSPAYQTRYDLPALPALIVLLAWGIAEFRVPSSGFRVQSNFTRYSILGTRYFIFALFAGAAVWSLPRQYDSRHRTDDYQSLSRIVQAYERPGDVIVFDPDWNFHLFLLDYRGSLPWRAIPLNQHVDAAWANQVFSGWSREYQSLWLLQEAGGHDAGA